MKYHPLWRLWLGMNWYCLRSIWLAMRYWRSEREAARSLLKSAWRDWRWYPLVIVSRS
jgi:hypothetical protein